MQIKDLRLPHAKLSLLLTVLLMAVSLRPACAQEATGIEAALPAIRKLNDPNALVGALSGAAMQRMQMDDLDKAIEYIDEALLLARESDDPAMLDTPLIIAGQVLNRLSPDATTRFMTNLLRNHPMIPKLKRRF